MNDINDTNSIEVCQSCGAKLKGDYCRKCGEKRIIPERDFNIQKFFRQLLGHFVHFDSKLLKSVWLLFSRPGLLTAEWIRGRRVGYMKPLQLFVVASLLFYFFLPSTTAHFTGPQDLIIGYQQSNRLMNLFHYDFGSVFYEKQALLQTSEAVLTERIKETAAQRSKTWLFVFIPLWGTVVFLFFKKQMPWLVPHLVFAMHALTFYILFDLSLHPFFYFWSNERFGKYIFLILMACFPVYQVLAAKRVFGDNWLLTILKIIPVALIFILLILAYRQIVTISVLHTL